MSYLSDLLGEAYKEGTACTKAGSHFWMMTGMKLVNTRWAMKALLNCNAVFRLRLDMPR